MIEAREEQGFNQPKRNLNKIESEGIFADLAF